MLPPAALALLALFAFAPPGAPAPAAAIIPTGPPAPHLSRDPGLQARLANRSSWRAFQATWGPGWGARWDERTGAPRFLSAPGVPVGRASALVADVAGLAGVGGGELQRARSRQAGPRLIQQWTRRYKGAEVVGDQVVVSSVNGRVNGVWVQLTPIGLAGAPAPGELVLPIPTEKGSPAFYGASDGLSATWARQRTEGPFVIYADRQGVERLRYDTRHFSTVSVTHLERTVGDASVTSPARGINVADASGGAAVTDSAGSHGLSGELSVELTGPTLAITNNYMPWPPLRGSGDLTYAAGTNISEAGAMVLHHYPVVLDWLTAVWPTHSLLSMQMKAAVDLPSSCNAYYSSGTINFYSAGGSCNNFGQIADVIYHEVGHGIHHYILAGGTFAGDVSEGSADFVSATLLNDAIVARNATTSGGYIRELETDHVYPRDVSGEVHYDGLIWASFLWNLRQQWVSAYGEATGVAMTDALFLGALSYGPTLTDLYEAVILADDDDGDLSNGTPHACELVTLLDQHGLGPGPIGVVYWDHVPLGPQASATVGYPVEFSVYDLTSGCDLFDPSSVRLWYSTEENGLPLAESATGDTGGAGDTADSGGADTGGGADPYPGWTSLELTQSGDTWTGVIPRQPATTHVRYFMEASSTDGAEHIDTYGGAEAGLYSFYVGDRQTLWCEDFEAGAPGWVHSGGLPTAPGGYTDQWEIGAPVGGSFDPSLAYGGTAIAGTNLSGDYAANNQQYLQSPVVTVGTPGPMFLLSYARWLTVEDALYDHATLYANGVSAWSNAATDGGTQHQLDTEWVLHELPGLPLLGGASTLELAFTLESDQGLEFGGWNLDDVCLVQLDDVERHYRTEALWASDDAPEVTITWEQPWMTPLQGTVLVRKAEGYPTGPTDGVVLDTDDDPLPGEAREVVDAEPLPGEVFYYALFAAGPNEADWYLSVVEGENADQGGVPAPEPLDTGDTGGVAEDSDPPAVDSDEPLGEDPSADGGGGGGGGGGKGCGCASPGPARGGALLLTLPALLLSALRARRRRSRA
jgi:hypothetical protein